MYQSRPQKFPGCFLYEDAKNQICVFSWTSRYAWSSCRPVSLSVGSFSQPPGKVNHSCRTGPLGKTAAPDQWRRPPPRTGTPCGAYQNYRKLFTDPILWVLLAFQLLFISQTVTDVFQKKLQGIYNNLTFYFCARHPIY